MSYSQFVSLILMGMLSLLLVGCASTKVTRVDVKKSIDLSGNWNDTDARLVSEEIIKDCLEKPWVINFVERHSKKPIVIVGSVRNRSHEHIDAQIFVKALEQSLLNSGKVQFVASKEERNALRSERDDQQGGFTDPETIKKHGREVGADFMLMGSINSVKDEVKGKYAILYQVNMEVIDLATNEKVWIGQKEIKKLVEKGKFSL